MNTTTYDSDPILTGMEIGVITLGEFLADPQNCRKISAQQRVEWTYWKQWKMRI